MVIICQKRQPLEKTRAYGSLRGVEVTEPSQWGDNACSLAAWPPGQHPPSPHSPQGGILTAKWSQDFSCCALNTQVIVSPFTSKQALVTNYSEGEESNSEVTESEKSPQHTCFPLPCSVRVSCPQSVCPVLSVCRLCCLQIDIPFYFCLSDLKLLMTELLPKCKTFPTMLSDVQDTIVIQIS